MTRCPECDTEIDLDEDEVEEGEILSCPECDVELEVTQTHPVHLIVISEDEDEDEDEEEEKSSVKEDEEDATRTKKRPNSFRLSSSPSHLFRLPHHLTGCEPACRPLGAVVVAKLGRTFLISSRNRWKEQDPVKSQLISGPSQLCSSVFSWRFRSARRKNRKRRKKRKRN